MCVKYGLAAWAPLPKNPQHCNVLPEAMTGKGSGVEALLRIIFCCDTLLVAAPLRFIRNARGLADHGFRGNVAALRQILGGERWTMWGRKLKIWLLPLPWPSVGGPCFAGFHLELHVLGGLTLSLTYMGTCHLFLRLRCHWLLTLLIGNVGQNQTISLILFVPFCLEKLWRIRSMKLILMQDYVLGR